MTTTSDHVPASAADAFSSVAVGWIAGDYTTPRPPVVTAKNGTVLAVSARDGVRLTDTFTAGAVFTGPGSEASAELVGVLTARQDTLKGPRPDLAELVASRALVLPRSQRWTKAVESALIGTWSDPLWDTAFLPLSALGALKAEARIAHRELVPIWRRRTRHGRVLSLDANLGDGLSLYDLVAADIDLLAHTTGGTFDDERLNRVLRSLAPAERLTVLAYAEGNGTTWTEAATVTGTADPEAFGERVRRKAKRLAAEQRRRAAQTQVGISQDSLPVGLEPGTER